MTNQNPSWVRFQMWDRWRDLTRFRVASEMALHAYGRYVDDFPITSDSSLIVRDPAGSNFKCDLNEFRSVLADTEQLYRVLMPSYAALVETLGIELVASLLDRGVDRTKFKGIGTAPDNDAAAERWLNSNSVEIWGAALLKMDNRGWSYLKGGLRPLLTAVVVRHLCAHGFVQYTTKAVDRLNRNFPGEAGLPVVGDRVSLDRATFQSHVGALQGFGRAIASSAANVGDPVLPVDP